MITIVMTSYMPDEARALCAQRVIQSLVDNLKSQEHLAFHLADDGSPINFYEDIIAYASAAGSIDNVFKKVTSTRVERRGIGGSLNEALEFLRITRGTKRWMYITDDWLLKKELNLDRANLLIHNYGFDCVRLGPIHPNLSGITRYYSDVEYYLQLWPTFGGYCFATRPFLANIRMFDVIGRFPEKLDAYDTERIYAETIAKHNDIAIAFLGPFDTTDLWEHIGDVSPVGKIQP